MSARCGRPGPPDAHTAGFELGVLERPHFHRMINQRVVVIGLKPTERQLGTAQAGEAGGHPPVYVGTAFRRLDFYLTGLVFVPHGGQEYTGAVEITVGGIQVRATDRQVPGIYLILHLHRAVAGWQLPGLLVDLGHRQGLAMTTGFDMHQMAGEVTNHVAAGNPGRQCKGLPSESGSPRSVFTSNRCASGRSGRIRYSIMGTPDSVSNENRGAMAPGW